MVLAGFVQFALLVIWIPDPNQSYIIFLMSICFSITCKLAIFYYFIVVEIVVVVVVEIILNLNLKYCYKGSMNGQVRGKNYQYLNFFL
jgi:hypothetical protein